ncbi:MAG TPA: acyltransferase family protein [Ramlibacter sp.]|nr:acyltransferase family protein [Ramlibacter sp.]
MTRAIDPAPADTGGERLHALDNLRALMMWLGIVMHVSVIHMVKDAPLPWRDERTTLLADLLASFIHAFRMPVFFILAGFFVAMLVQRRGAWGMLVHRLRRVGLPFAIFWPPLFALTAVLALLFLNRMVRGAWGLEQVPMPGHSTIEVGYRPATMHLWFLWLLLWLCVLTVPVLWVAQRMPRQVTQAVSALFGRMGGAAWGFAVLALPLAVLGSFYRTGVLAPTGSFLPPLSGWLHNGLFYVFGWTLWRHQQALFAQYQRHWKRYAWAGLLFYLATGALVEAMRRASGVQATHWPLWIALAYNCASWLWSFALIGLFLRTLQRPHPALGYLADSSYWVYLVHMPLTVGFGALLFGAPLPAVVKMAINIAATTAVCLASYHLLVRFTAVSTLLNGRRHARKPAA